MSRAKAGVRLPSMRPPSGSSADERGGCGWWRLGESSGKGRAGSAAGARVEGEVRAGYGQTPRFACGTCPVESTYCLQVVIDVH